MNSEVKFCGECGIYLAGNERFCGKCGAEVLGFLKRSVGPIAFLYINEDMASAVIVDESA